LRAIDAAAPRPSIDTVFDALGFGDYLDAVVSADKVGSGKPDLAIFFAAADRLGPPSSCIVVEDAPAGLEAARRAGMRSIGVLSAHHTQLAADLVVPSLEALAPDAFDRLLHRD
jgi:beta-phosphoglucomutase-like phosphatase (HAD superfamily)